MLEYSVLRLDYMREGQEMNNNKETGSEKNTKLRQQGLAVQPDQTNAPPRRLGDFWEC